jgi:hypothetical protein
MLNTAVLQRLAVVGIWAPLLVMLFLIAVMALVGSMQPIPARLLGLPFLVFSVGLLVAHLLVIFSAIGLTLVLSKRSQHPKLTLVSALVGLVVGLPVLATLYTNATLPWLTAA